MHGRKTPEKFVVAGAWDAGELWRDHSTVAMYKCLAREFVATIFPDSSILTFTLPDRLIHLVNENEDIRILDSMTDLACRSSFLNWVKTIRPHAADVAVEEVLLCPMLWCRRKFQDPNEVVCHAFQCPCLWNAWYWCPYHNRPERYMICNIECEVSTVKSVFVKLKDGLAVAFSKWLIRRRSLVETRNLSDVVETAGGDVSRSESLRPERANRLSSQELLGSTPYHMADEAGDTIDHRNQGPQASLSEFPCCDPVYSTAELPDRNRIVALGTENAISSPNIHELQAGSSQGRVGLDTEIDVENFVRDSRFVDNRSACSSFYNRYEEIIDAYTI